MPFAPIVLFSVARASEKTHSSPRCHRPYLSLLPIPIPVAGGAHLSPTRASAALARATNKKSYYEYFSFDSHTNISSCVWCSVCDCVWCNKLKLERENTQYNYRERCIYINIFLEGMFSLWSLSKKFGLSTVLFYPIIIFLHQHTIISSQTHSERQYSQSLVLSLNYEDPKAFGAVWFHPYTTLRSPPPTIRAALWSQNWR